MLNQPSFSFCQNGQRLESLIGALHTQIGARLNGRALAGRTNRQCMIVERNAPGLRVGYKRNIMWTISL